ncbi:MAG: phosphatidylserine/phosphatidylglycerophosphate/cardiolipin synthase family protein [Candidatus Sericytochromatia bacterium]
MFVKKFVFTFSLASMLMLTSCKTGIDTPEQVKDETKTQSWFNGNGNNVPDNGDVNIRLDNLLLSRRTYNNSDPKFYIDGAEAFPAMEKMISEAKKSLYIETFIWHDDETGRRIADKVVEKVRQGVEVKVLIDELGLLTKKGDNRIFDYMKNKGVDIRRYNKLLFGIQGVNITHRKLIIADGDKVITGGMNFGDEYSKIWHDTMTEVSGECVYDIQSEFYIDWEKAGGKRPATRQTLEPGKVYGNTPIRIAVTSAFESKKKLQIKDAMLTAIGYAKNKIRMAGPYFSDDDMIRKLIEARKRGVDVEVIIPKTTDSKTFNNLNMGTAQTFIKGDIKVNFYMPRFSHTKAAIFDDLTIVGSSNPDSRSFRENQELNLIVENNNFKDYINSKIFTEDLKDCEVQTLDSVKVGFFKKLQQTALEVIDYYL